MVDQDFAPKGLRAEAEGSNHPATIPEVVLKGEDLLDKEKSVAQDIQERVRQVAAETYPRRPASAPSEGDPPG